MGRKLRHAFNEVLKAAGELHCEDMHHKQSQYHEKDHVCPVEYNLGRQINIVREYLKEHDLI